MAAPRRPRSRFVLVVLVLLAVSLVTLSARTGGSGVFNRLRAYARDAANPFQSAAHSALQPIGDFLYGAFDYHSLQQENQLLRREVAAALAAQAQAESEQAEAEQILSQQHLAFLGGIPTVSAQVVSLGSANFEQTIEINRGATSGVAVGEPVVSAAGLVGSVSAVTSHLATVTLLDDPSFAVGVRDVGSLARVKGSKAGGALAAASGAVGAATGQGEGNPLSVGDVNVGENVKRGDQLVTSGLQLEHFPAGIPVGTVTSVYSPPGGLQLVISMKAFVDLADLQIVQVLLWSAQTG